MNHKRTALIVASMITAHLALAGSPPIDRQALVTRHNVELNEAIIVQKRSPAIRGCARGACSPAARPRRR